RHADGAVEAGEGEETVGQARDAGEQRTVAVEDLDVAVDRGGDDDLGDAVVVEVGRRHGHAAGETRKGDEAGDQGAIGAAEDLDVTVDPVGRHDDVGLAVAVDVADGDVDGALEVGEGEEAANLHAGGAVEDLDVTLRRVGADDDVGDAVAGHIARR